METRSIEVGETPKLVLVAIGGDLRLNGQTGRTVEANAVEGSGLSLEQVSGVLRLSSRSDVTVYLPEDCRIEGDTVGGDVMINGVRGEVLIHTIGGDARLRRVGQISMSLIGGSLMARRVSGDLSVDRVGGDAVVDQVSGSVRLRGVGGDARLSEVEGLVEANVGGDVRLHIDPAEGTESRIQAGGDVACRLPSDASVRVTLNAGGDIRLGIPVDAEPANGHMQLILGKGAADLDLTSGGDVHLRHGELEVEAVEIDLGEAIAARVGAELEAHMTELEGRFGRLGEELQGFDSERINAKIRETVARAQRKAAQARQRAAERARKGMERGAMEGASFSQRPRGAESLEQERKAILGMLENGVISVEEAEKLLKALEGEG